MQKMTMGFSSCPNDTFIFDAIINKKIDLQGLHIEPVIADVEELNKKAFRGELDVTKLSYHAYAHLLDNYVLLNAGSALGENCGPLLISRKKIPPASRAITPLKIAIPGKYTTANLLFSIAYPQAADKIEMLFSDIEEAVLNDEVDVGVIIHENRFTYEQKGLKKVIDLGEFWQMISDMPIPLGGIVIRRDLPDDIKSKFDCILRESVELALRNPDSTMNYVKKYAQEMDEKVMMDHIRLYVNDYTKDLGADGKKAVKYLFKTARENKIIPPGISKDLFLEKTVIG